MPCTMSSWKHPAGVKTECRTAHARSRKTCAYCPHKARCLESQSFVSHKLYTSLPCPSTFSRRFKSHNELNSLCTHTAMDAKAERYGEMPQALHHRETRSVCALLKEDPYVGYVAMVSFLRVAQHTLKCNLGLVFGDVHPWQGSPLAIAPSQSLTPRAPRGCATPSLVWSFLACCRLLAGAHTSSWRH